MVNFWTKALSFEWLVFDQSYQKIIHNKIEGNLNYTNLIFIPSEKPFDLLNAEKISNLKLFIKKVFFQIETSRM